MFLKAAAEGKEDRIEMLRDSAPRYEYETRRHSASSANSDVSAFYRLIYPQPVGTPIQ